MGVESGAREEILRRIRTANGARAAGSDLRREWEALPRDYRRTTGADRAETLRLFLDRLHDYDAHTSVTTDAGLRKCIDERLAERGYPRMVVPHGFPVALLPDGGSFVEDHDFSPRELDGFEGVVTTATVAIAETGTLVLQNVAGQGRRAATLVPDFHLCLVDVDDVVHSVPEAMDRLAGTSALPTTFVSGPSATADIEMTRIKGVHGPRFLEVIVFSRS